MTSPGRRPSPVARSGERLAEDRSGLPLDEYYVTAEAVLSPRATTDVIELPTAHSARSNPQPTPRPTPGPLPGPRDRRPERARRLPGLDGLRAIAVVAVMLFHLDPTLLPGGFLGVDFFFVISGYLITRLLLTEMTKLGTLQLGRFYVRRIRRLWPAVTVLMVIVSLASILIWRDELTTLRASVISSLGYVTNWWLIGDHQSYFVSTGRPPMLQHLWSLAIEEQYYLLWPAAILLVTGVAWKRNRQRPVRIERVAWLALLLAGASTIAMAVIAISDNVPYEADSSRVYFGTDTHSMGLFLGSAAGALSILAVRRAGVLRVLRVRSAAASWFGDALAAACLGVVGLQFLHQSEYTPGLYRGGFLLFDAFAAVVIWVVVAERSKLGWLLERPILRGIGQRSYSIYLWHWPVAVVTRPGIDVHGSLWFIQLARVGLILLLAEASYRLVERPLRAGGLKRPKPPAVPRTAEDLRLIMGAVAGLTCLAVLLGAAQSGAASPSGSTSSDFRSAPPRVTPSVVAPIASSNTGPKKDPATATVITPTKAPVVARTQAPPLPVTSLGNPSISGFGDSVLLGASPALRALDPHTTVNAVEGRQAYGVLKAVAAAHRRGTLGSVVVIHVGNNGVISPSQLSDTLSMLSDRKRVILLNDHVNRDWQGINNQNIPSVGSHFANVTVIDWNSIADANRGWFYKDGLHLNGAGAAYYAQMILNAANR